MPCMLLRNRETEVRQYCVEHRLSFDKLISSALSWDSEEVFVQHYEPNPEREKLGLLDDIPMPLVLIIRLENGKLRFVQTDITHKYLGADREAALPPAAKRPAARRLPSRGLATA